ncbi:hypothetical protein GCM10017559_05100 [Streptosporangium longisporum]|uniref:Uncharacterized protein n=1 Tax=Streptosporangium longisporum TaxID=46187 RepID=A0ABN3XSS7_9ACTN
MGLGEITGGRGGGGGVGWGDRVGRWAAGGGPWGGEWTEARTRIRGGPFLTVYTVWAVRGAEGLSPSYVSADHKLSGRDCAARGGAHLGGANWDLT